MLWECPCHYPQHYHQRSGNYGYHPVCCPGADRTSHILNAEGEKIQKVVAMEDVAAETLLAVNKSVESMVNSVTKLEMILQSKLSLFDGFLGE